MEKLSHLINSQVAQGKWKPMKASRNGPTISHLFFAYGLILFGEASRAQADVMLECLNYFCANLGKKK